MAGEEQATEELPSGQCPVVQFDHHEHMTREQSQREWAERREQCPVAWSESHGGFWVASQYDAIAEGFRNWESFSSSRTARASGPGGGDPGGLNSLWIAENPMPTVLVPEELDPPAWELPTGPGRAAVAARDQARLHRQRPGAHHPADRRFIEKGECDLIHDLTSPLACRCLPGLAGLPRRGPSTVQRGLPRHQRLCNRLARVPGHHGRRHLDGRSDRGGGPRPAGEPDRRRDEPTGELRDRR